MIIESISLVTSAFQNRYEFSIADDEIYQTQTITMAVPIYGANREVVEPCL